MRFRLTAVLVLALVGIGLGGGLSAQAGRSGSNWLRECKGR